MMLSGLASKPLKSFLDQPRHHEQGGNGVSPPPASPAFASRRGLLPQRTR